MGMKTEVMAKRVLQMGMQAKNGLWMKKMILETTTRRATIASMIQMKVTLPTTTD